MEQMSILSIFISIIFSHSHLQNVQVISIFNLIKKLSLFLFFLSDSIKMSFGFKREFAGTKNLKASLTRVDSSIYREENIYFLSEKKGTIWRDRY